MNKKFIIAWIVLFVAWLLGSFVVHGVVLRSDYMQLTNLFRAEGDEQKYFPLMILAHVILSGAIGRLLIWKTVIAYSPSAGNYMDQALTPVSDDGDETLDLLTKTTGARAAVAHAKKIAELTGVRVA